MTSEQYGDVRAEHEKLISSIRHVGIVVRNLDESIKFYCGILGLSIYKRHSEKPGQFIDKLVGINNVELEWVKVIIPNGGLIELLQYHSHPDPDIFCNIVMSPSNRLGCSHISLTVKNLSRLYYELTENGYTCKSEPLYSPDGKVKILYCHDPDGVILELIEDL
jgi:catechol 2,3-dioxygenase-like lactoylglutathione lyase family enzyme